MNTPQNAAVPCQDHAGGIAPLGRRGLLGAAFAMAVPRSDRDSPRPPGAALTPADWLEFRRRFIMPDGRVIDTGNNNVSHSEGQGAALLFAARFDELRGTVTASRPAATGTP